MKPIRIAVCGAQQVGKSTLLQKLSAICGWRELVWTRMEDITLLELHARVKGIDYLIRTLPGSIIYFKRRVTDLLRDADLIVYVIKPDSMEGDDTIQMRFLADYLRIANSFGHDWESGKWVLVLNKVDYKASCEVLEKFPEALRSSIVRTQGINGQGLDLLLEEIELRVWKMLKARM